MGKKITALLASLCCVFGLAGAAACNEPSGESASQSVTESLPSNEGSSSIAQSSSEESSSEAQSSSEESSSEAQSSSEESSSEGENSSAVHTHTFDGTWTKDTTGHYYAATCGHDEKKDFAAHIFDANGVCAVCSWTVNNVAEKEFEDVILLQDVYNFTSKRELDVEFSVKVVNGGTYTAEAGLMEQFVATPTKGHVKDTQIDDENNYIYFVHFDTNEPGFTPPQTESLPINVMHQAYFEVDQSGREYTYVYESLYPDVKAWVKHNFADRVSANITYNAYMRTELSTFEAVAKQYALFTFNEETKTYKNALPLSFTEVNDTDPREGVTTVTMTNVYFEFKITNGVVEWMEMSCDYTAVTTYDFSQPATKEWYLYQNGELRGLVESDTQTGTMSVRYYDINESVVENFPTDYLLGENVDNGCAHVNLKAMEDLGTSHRQRCEDCNAIVLWEAHGYEDGVCVDCSHACLHQYLYGESCAPETNEKHSDYCTECSANVLVAHSYDEQQYCAACDYTYCAHDGENTWGRLNNQEHGFTCQNCYLSVIEEHTYVEGTCTVCDADYCAHSNLGSVEYNADPREHVKECPDCYDRISAPHTFVNEVCTVCGYEVCHHENVRNWSISEYSHSAMCGDCYEHFMEEHTLANGVCTVCGYDENCEHTNRETANMGGSYHVEVCTDCGYQASETVEQCTYENGVCDECNAECPHYSYTEGVCENCGKACTHTFDEYGWCTTCYYQCQHDNYTDGVCDECNAECQHTYVDGVCENCGKECTHTFDEYGWCGNCYYQCEHSYTNSVCNKCNAKCPHYSYTEGVCDYCSRVCTHTFDEYGWCGNCYYQCEHSYTNSVCNKCNAKCQHSYVNDVCENCSHKCMHENVVWDVFEYAHSASCPECYVSLGDEHTIENGVCTVCGYDENCAHINAPSKPYGGGHANVCAACGYINEDTIENHTYTTEGVCTVCNEKCQHNYVDGVCEYCSHECTHTFDEYGQCTVCYYQCEHSSYEGGYCTLCNKPEEV